MKRLSKLKSKDLDNIDEIQKLSKQRQQKMKELGIEGDPMKEMSEDLERVLNTCSFPKQ